MKTMKVGMLMAMAVLVAATVTVSFAQEKSAAEPKVLHDGDGAKTMRFENMHQVRFIELFFAVRDPKTGKLVAPCYNTMYSDQGHARVERHLSAGAGRKPRPGKDSEGIWRRQSDVERPQDLDARIGSKSLSARKGTSTA